MQALITYLQKNLNHKVFLKEKKKKKHLAPWVNLCYYYSNVPSFTLLFTGRSFPQNLVWRIFFQPHT